MEVPACEMAPHIGSSKQSAITCGAVIPDTRVCSPRKHLFKNHRPRSMFFKVEIMAALKPLTMGMRLSRVKAR